MRELRAVRVSEDGKEILLSETSDAPAAASEPGYLLRADDRLRGMLRPRPATPSDTRPESALSPREIQARLRAGETAEDVARAAGIPVTRVARYEAPIAAERVRIVDEVRRATAPGPHRVSPGRPLGSVVDERLTDEGFDPALAQWLARRRPDGTWLVTVDLADLHAEWSWDSGARRVRNHDNGAQRMVSPSRSSAESLIAVAQAAGVTTEPAAARPEPPSPIAPARAVGESLSHTTDESSTRPVGTTRSGLVVLPGEGRSEASAARSQAPVAPTLDDVPGGGPSEPIPASTPKSWTPGASDAPGSMGTPRGGAHEPSASSSDVVDAAADEPLAEVQAERPARPQTKAGRKRSAVPAWDDIVFGARRS